MSDDNNIATLADPEWPDILRACQDQLAARIHTSLPGTVTSYDSTTQLAAVQLAVQLQGESVPPLADIPVMWPGGAAGFLHVPLAAGDPVLVVFSEEDYSRWFTTGSVSAPLVLARHGLHAIAIPGLWRAPAAATGGHVTLAATSELRLGSDAASVFVALANLVDARLETIRTTWFVNTGVGPSSTPAAAGVPALASVAATKVKAV